MFTVALTGNIASGKSTALGYFASLGVEVISADKIAKNLTAKNQPAYFTIKNYFGEGILNSENELNRALLRSIVFSNEEARIWLENLLHPLIRKAIENEALASLKPYSIIEIPLLTSLAFYPYINRVLVILAKLPQQIARLRERDGCTKAEALAILATQPSDKSRKELADDLIINDGDLKKLSYEIKNLHEIYLHLASKKTS